MNSNEKKRTRAEHTEGPWVPEVVDGRLRVSTVERRFEGSSEGLTVATICNARWADASSRANARLIASAPDLLAALVDLMSKIDDGILVSCGLANGGDEWLERTLDGARAAIAKARLS